MKIFDSKIVEKYIIASETDINGIITYVSPGFCKVSGYAESELIGKNHNIVRHHDTSDSIFKGMWKTIQNGKSWSGIIKNRKKDGSSYWVDSHIEPMFDENGGILGYSSVRFDVTSEYKLAELNVSLMSSAKTYEKLFNSIQSGVALIDFEGNFVDVNDYLCEMLEVNKENFLRQNIFLRHGENKKLKELLENKQELFLIDFTEEKECCTTSGKKIWIEAKYKYFNNDRIIITIQDITSKKDLASASTLLIKQSKDADMGEMISMIAHQWRQPLATIESILAKVKAKRELKMYSGNDLTLDTAKISQITTHLSKTIDYFRDYLRPKTGEFLPFVEIFSGVKNIVEPLCKNQEIKLILKKDESFRYFVDDRIDQVLLNLYKNSLDAFSEKDIKGSIITEILEEDENIIVKITDNAGGVDEKILDKILEPYFSTKSKNGTGLGLYMCKNIVTDIMHGEFSYENINDGITFYIKLNKIKKEKIDE